MLAASAAVTSLDLGLGDLERRVLGIGLTTAALVCANLSFAHWVRTERAMRRGEPLPRNAGQSVLWITLSALALGLVIAELR